MRADFDARLADQCQESGLLVEAAKARVIDLERELTVRDSRIVDLQVQQDAEVTELRGQVAVLEAKVREVLEDGKSDAVRLADRIADLSRSPEVRRHPRFRRSPRQGTPGTA
ncbi:MAG: hypothetical protein ABGY41_20985 [Candidatus Poribacteria bacterium]